MSEEELRTNPNGLYGRRRLLKLGAAGAAGIFLTACAKKVGTASSMTTMAGVGGADISSGRGTSGRTGSSAGTGTAEGEPGSWAFASSISSNGRYVVDRHGAPWLMVGDSAWGLAAGVQIADMATYFSTRAAQGFNCVLTTLVSDTYSRIARRNASTFDGIKAFTGKIRGLPDLSTPNPAYWERMDTMVTLAASHGITMLLVPADTASGFGITYCMRMVRANGAMACVDYGKFLGNRYKHSANVMWMNGNDYATAAPYGEDDQYVGGISDGIRSVAPGQLQTVELIPGIRSTVEAYSYMGTAWPARIDLDQAYPGTTDPSYAIGLTAYAASPIKPVFMGEGLYEGNVGWTTFRLRKQAYWTMVTGCYGQLYGNSTVYPFRSGWQAALSTTAVAEVGYWESLFTGLAWSTLIPDTTNSFLTGGYSSGTTRAFAGLASNGSLGVIYAPVNGPIQVNMAKMRGSTTARWYDPTAGTFSTVGGSPFPSSGMYSFSNPGNHSDSTDDWVLVLTA
jgi:hypothetical protein